MARTEYLQQFAREHSLKCITIEDLVRYRLKREVLLRQTARTNLSTRWGDFTAIGFECLLERQEHMALLYGDVTSGCPLIRIHEVSSTSFSLAVLTLQPKCRLGYPQKLLFFVIFKKKTGSKYPRTYYLVMKTEALLNITHRSCCLSCGITITLRTRTITIIANIHYVDVMLGMC